MFCCLQENCNLLVSNDYSEKTRRAMAQLSEKEHSFELVEVIQNLIVFCVPLIYLNGLLYKFLTKSVHLHRNTHTHIMGWSKGDCLTIVVNSVVFGTVSYNFTIDFHFLYCTVFE